LVKALLLFAFLASVSLAKFSWQDCGGPNTHYKISSVVMKPLPAHRSQNVSSFVNGTTNVAITGGKWELKIMKGAFLALTLSGNVCDLSPTCRCPCPPGQVATQLAVPVPWYAISGEYSGRLEAKEASGQLLGCVSFTFDVGVFPNDPETGTVKLTEMSWRD